MSIFDNLDRTKLKQMLQCWVAAGRCYGSLASTYPWGVLEGKEHSALDLGTARRSGLSRMFGGRFPGICA